MEGDEMAAVEDAVVSEADECDAGVTPPGSGGKGVCGSGSQESVGN